MRERTANKYCWLGPILFSAGVLLCLYIYVFSIIPFFSSWGWGIKAGGGTYSQKTGGKRTEYFVIVRSEGDSMYISIVYICDEMRWLFVWHYLLPVLWFYIQCFSVDNIYLVCVLFFSCFFCFFILSLSFLVFYFLLFVLLRLLHGLLLLSSNEVTQLLFVFV